MELREDQIQRYSRQILLREVGGRGQRRLLDAVVRVEGRSAAIDVALAALASSGSPVIADASDRTGYLFARSLESLSADAIGAEPVRVWLGPLAAAGRVGVDLIRVGVGEGSVVAVPAGAPWPPAEDASVPADPVALGSFAALLAQRLVLGLEAELRAVRWETFRWKAS